MPRDWASGNKPERKPYDSGAFRRWSTGMLEGMYWSGTLKRLGKMMSSAVPLMWSGPGLMMLSRLVCSIWNRSTCGVKGMLGGKCPPMPTGATKPGPRRVELGSVMSGLESTSRCVMVDWLMNWTVREVNGAALLEKNAPVRASARAPSMAKVSVAGSLVICGRDVALDAHAQQIAAAIDDGDDGIVAGRGRRGAIQQLADVTGGQDRVGVGRGDRSRRQ